MPKRILNSGAAVVLAARRPGAARVPRPAKPVDPRGESAGDRLPAGEVARAGLILIGLGVGSYLLWRLIDVLLLVFLAVLLATAIEPLVKRLRRGPFSKGTGALAVYGAIVLPIGVVAYLTLPDVAAQSTSFVEGLPARIESLRSLVGGLEAGPSATSC